MKAASLFVSLFVLAGGPVNPGGLAGDSTFSGVAELTISVQPLEIVDPGLPFETLVSFRNHGPFLATGVVVTIDAPRVTSLAGPEECVASGPGQLVCDVGLLGDRVKRLRIRGVAPDDLSGTSFSVTARIEGDERDPYPPNNQAAAMQPMWRTFYATNRLDSGEGSLREAIEDSNAVCTGESRCKVAFRIPPEGNAWSTIAPSSPLPRVTGTGVFLDATTQTRFFGDTNPDGPEIELSGDLLDGEGNGLLIDAGSNAAVRGLAINRFPEAGVAVMGRRDGLYDWSWDPAISSVSDCYIGTDPTGMIALPNSIGVHISVYGDGTDLWGIWWVNDNLIGGNERSGVFSVSGTREIRGNRIGVSRDFSAALGNGASGIYIGPDSNGVTIESNTIAFNHHFGIAVSEAAYQALILTNSIYSNGQLGIDVGLDGVTTARRVPKSGPPEIVIELPEIWGANWDPVNGRTVIEGALPRPHGLPSAEYLISFYANDEVDPSGYGEGRSLLGVAKPDQGGHFVFAHPADLRGKFVSATATSAGVEHPGPSEPNGLPRTRGTTTEFSRAVEVR